MYCNMLFSLCFSECHGNRYGSHMTIPGTLEAVSIMQITERKHIETSINGIRCNCVIVCEAKNETQRLDIRRDGMGTWHETKRFTKMVFGDAYVWRINYINNSYNGLRRTEIFRKKRNSDGSVGHLISPMVMAYTFKGSPPEKINIVPHGNSKSNLPFHPSTRSLINDLHDAVNDEPSMPPARIYNSVR